MSEYQYYEFLAIDRPLSGSDRALLRDISTRATITAGSFVNEYQWGDFKGDPDQFMDCWFDLHLYLANWGSRRLMIRLPERLVDRRVADACLESVECASLRSSDGNLILDIGRDELDLEDWADGEGRLAELAPLRAALLGGDIRLFYMLWLMAVEDGDCDDHDPEPLPGLGRLTPALEAFAAFFAIDPDLVEAAAELSGGSDTADLPIDVVGEIIAALPDPEKTLLLSRLFSGDPHVGAELRAKVRGRAPRGDAKTLVAARTAGDLRARAATSRRAREQVAARLQAAEQSRLAAAVANAREERLAAIGLRGVEPWDEVEAEINLRHAAAYARAVDLLCDLKIIAAARGSIDDFDRRLRLIRERHGRKPQLMIRLEKLG